MASKLPLKIDSTNGIVRNFESGDFTALSAGGTNADLSATGGTSQVLKQSSAGAAITVGTLTVAEGGTGQTSWTKGDLLVTPGGTTLNKLAVGTDGYVLTADAASTNGVKWAAASGGGSLTGSGTTGKIPKWSGSTALGDSLLTESGTVITAAASLAFTAVAAASASAYWAGAVTGSLVYNVPTGSFHAIAVNNTTVAAVNATGLCGISGTTGKVLVDGNLNLRSTSVGGGSEYYVGRNSALVYNVPTGIDHVFAVNNNTVANLNSSGLMVGTTGASPARRLEVRSTSAQIRASYSATEFCEINSQTAASTITGCATASGTLTLKSTSHATKGKVIFGNAGTTAYDEVNERFGIGTASPSYPLEVNSSSATQFVLAHPTGTSRFGIQVAATTGATTFDFAGTAPILTINKPVGFNQYATPTGLFSTQAWSRGCGMGDSKVAVFASTANVAWGIGNTGGILYFLSSTADSAVGTGIYEGNWSTAGLMLGGGSTPASRKLEVRSTSAQIRASYDGSNYQEIAVSSGGQLKISGAGTYATVIQIGTGSSVAAATDHQINIGTGTTTASESVAIGRTPTAAGGTVAIGYNANGSTYTNGTIVGRTASIGANSSVAIGSAASAGTGGNPAVAIGQDTVAVGDSVAISRSATTTAAGQFVCGSGNPAITDVYFNKGVVHATPTAWTLNGTGGSGTDIAGGKLQLAGGKPTGSGVGGSVVIQTAPAGTTGTTLRSLSDRLTVDHLGNIYPGTGALSTSATDGHFYIPTCAGTPTGVPTSFTGRCAIIMDTTNHKLYVYDGGWVAMN